MCFFLLLFSCNNKYGLQSAFDANIENVINDAKKGKSKSVDLAIINNSDWDSVYVFFDYNSLLSVKSRLSWVNWNNIVIDGAVCPDNINRFVFVKDNTALSYINFNYGFDVHFKKYYNKKFMTYTECLNYDDCIEMRSFSKNNSKFKLSIMIDSLLNNKREYYYVDPEYCASHDKIINLYNISLHPESGCSKQNCLMNKEY